MFSSIRYDHVTKDEMGSTLDVWQADQRACVFSLRRSRPTLGKGGVWMRFFWALCIDVLGSDSLTLV